MFKTGGGQSSDQGLGMNQQISFNLESVIQDNSPQIIISSLSGLEGVEEYTITISSSSSFSNSEVFNININDGSTSFESNQWGQTLYVRIESSTGFSLIITIKLF